MKIGFFDSGIGGLSVLKEAYKLLPGEDYIYYADSANIPYGKKTRKEIRNFVLQAAEFFAVKEIKALVIACNTATSAAVNDLRKIYGFPIIGMEPAIKPAFEKEPEKRILVLATSFTLMEEKLESLVSRFDGKDRLDRLSLDDLVSFAENFDMESTSVKDYLSGCFNLINPEKYGCVVIGCTHFIYFQDIIRSYFLPGTEIINGNRGTVNHLKNILEKKGLVESSGKGSFEFYNSGIRETDDFKLDHYIRMIKED